MDVITESYSLPHDYSQRIRQLRQLLGLTQQQFADLKRALGSVTEEEWAALPEVGGLFSYALLAFSEIILTILQI